MRDRLHYFFPQRVPGFPAVLAAAALTLSAACALKAPPNAAKIKEEAFPATTLPGQWTAKGAGAGMVADNWLVTFHDEQLNAAVAEAISYNADLRVGAARVEQALLYARLAGAKLYPSVDFFARRGSRRRHLDAGRFRVRPAVHRGARRAQLVPGHRSRPSGGAGQTDGRAWRRTGTPRRNPKACRRRQ